MSVVCLARPEKASPEEVSDAIISLELIRWRTALRGDKLVHARTCAAGEKGIHGVLTRSLRATIASQDGRCDTTSLRLGHPDLARLFWAAACADWVDMYMSGVSTPETPEQFLDGYVEPAGFSPIDPATEKFDVLLDGKEGEGQRWVDRNFETSRPELKGITVDEFSRLAKNKAPFRTVTEKQKGGWSGF